MASDCPACGSPVTTLLVDASPGDIGSYRCADCGHEFQAVVPEPPDEYQGDGVFAENH